MSLANIINRMRQHFPDFSFQMSGSILSSLISQLNYELEQIQTKQQSKLDLFEQSANSLDELAQMLGLTRHVVVGLDENATVPDQVSIIVKNPQHSILTVFQSLYGKSENFPKNLRVTDGSNVFEIVYDFTNINQLNVHQLIVPVRFAQFAFQNTNANTLLKVHGAYKELEEYLTFKTTTTLTLYQYVESDEQLRLRIQTRLQNLAGPTSDYIVSTISSLFPNVRYVLVKNFARGLQTQDVIVFPTIQQIYDENYQLITENSLAQTIEQYFQNRLQLGVDVQFFNAEQKQIEVEVFCSNVDPTQVENFTETVKRSVVNLLYSYPIGQTFSLTDAKFKADLDRTLAVVPYTYRLDSVILKFNNSVVSQIDVADNEYLVARSISVQLQ